MKLQYFYINDRYFVWYIIGFDCVIIDPKFVYDILNDFVNIVDIDFYGFNDDIFGP